MLEKQCWALHAEARQDGFPPDFYIVPKYTTTNISIKQAALYQFFIRIY
jgi:hypothetical protein